jgi:flagellar biosynthesis/type III secretory pathway chaperone
METVLAELLDILSRQHRIYLDILTLTEEEHAALARRRPDSILETTRRKETMALQIKTLEESRRAIYRRLGRQWGIPTEELRLQDAIARCTGDLSVRLSEIRDALRDVTVKLTEYSARNMRLCQGGIETIHTILQSAVRDVAKSGNNSYGPARNSTVRPCIMHWRT